MPVDDTAVPLRFRFQRSKVGGEQLSAAGVPLGTTPLAPAAEDVSPPAELARRIETLSRRLLRNDPGREPVRCFGCGRLCGTGKPNSSVLRAGWRTRLNRCPKYVVVICPECFAAHGWGEVGAAQPQGGAA